MKKIFSSLLIFSILITSVSLTSTFASPSGKEKAIQRSDSSDSIDSSDSGVFQSANSFDAGYDFKTTEPQDIRYLSNIPDTSKPQLVLPVFIKKVTTLEDERAASPSQSDTSENEQDASPSQSGATEKKRAISPSQLGIAENQQDVSPSPFTYTGISQMKDASTQTDFPEMPQMTDAFTQTDFPVPTDCLIPPEVQKRCDGLGIKILKCFLSYAGIATIIVSRSPNQSISRIISDISLAFIAVRSIKLTAETAETLSFMFKP